MAFWLDEEVARDYSQLSVIAIDLLIVPGSSAPVERTFSTAGDACSGKRNRLTDKNLEREVLIRKKQTVSLSFFFNNLMPINSAET